MSRNVPKVIGKKQGKHKNKELVDLYNKVFEFMREEDREIAEEMGDTVTNLNFNKTGTSKREKLT